VFGDIGTSPLYTLKNACIRLAGSIRIETTCSACCRSVLGAHNGGHDQIPGLHHEG